MGCSTMTYTKMEGKIIKQETIELDISNINKNKELSQAQSLITIITNLRNQIIYDFDNLIYNTGACIFKCPNIIHCTQCLFYKISSECCGNLNLAEFTYKEDPPYFIINKEKIKPETQIILDELFEFIIKLKDYKILINQLDKETPKLMYIIFENNNNISKENLDKISKAINLFREMVKLRNNILSEYKNQIYDLIMSNVNYCAPINKIGQLAIAKNVNDIYEIAFLFNQLKNDDNFMKYYRREDMSLYKSIKEAKQNMEKKLVLEKQEENKNNFDIKQLNISLSQSSTLNNSYKIYFTKS